MKKFVFLVFSMGFMHSVMYAQNMHLQWSKHMQYMKVDDAIDYCKTLSENGKEDWRLPSIKELFTLVNYNRKTPLSTSMWSSSPHYYGRYVNDYRKNYYWFISKEGLIIGTDKNYRNYIRCVRNKK